MAAHIKHDPFARGSFERECVTANNQTCDWCGQYCKRLFTYVWISDASSRPNIFHKSQKDHRFCNFQCFTSFNS